MRFWDMAATEPQPDTDPDWTVGVLMAAWRGQFWIVDVQRLRGSPPKERRSGRCILVGWRRLPAENAAALGRLRCRHPGRTGDFWWIAPIVQAINLDCVLEVS